MATQGKIILSGFDLDSKEKEIVNNLIQSYADKIKERIGYGDIKLRLKKARHGKEFLHEVQGILIANNKKFNALVTDYNLFAALAEVFEKLMHEAEHEKRTKRQIK